MDKKIITTNTLSSVLTAQATNTLVAVTNGSGYLCIGADSPIENCLPVSAGYQIILPPSTVVKAAKSGGDSITFVTAPMGA